MAKKPSSKHKNHKQHKKVRTATGQKKKDKVYRYLFRPLDQYAIQSATSGQQSFTGGTNGPLNSAYWLVPVPGSAGIAGFYDTGFSMQFSAANLLNFSSFAGIYDQYRIKSIIVKIEYMSNYAGVNSLAMLPSINTALDYDNAAIPSTLQQVLGIQGSTQTDFGNKGKMTHTILIKPKPSALMFSDAITSIGYGEGNRHTWMDCANANNVYYGLKGWISNIMLGGNTINTALKFSYWYSVEFRSPTHNY